jgi:hypothetical protein
VTAEKIITKCCKLVTFAYKNPGQQKGARMNILLTVFQANKF